MHLKSDKLENTTAPPDHMTEASDDIVHDVLTYNIKKIF